MVLFTWMQFFYNPIAFPTIVAYVMSLLLKLLISSWNNKRLTLKTFLKDGGMPSSHTALVVGLTTSIFLVEGASSVFWLAVVFALIVMKDAIGVRFQTGRLGMVMNKMVKTLKLGEQIKDKQMKELVGHTPLQVAAGILVGILFSWLAYALVF
jgi:hypothetical protein